MIQRVIEPVGWVCTLKECPPGPFVTVEDPYLLCFKSEYGYEGRQEIMSFNSAGEYFCGKGNEEMVQPVKMVTEEVEGYGG